MSNKSGIFKRLNRFLVLIGFALSAPAFAGVVTFKYSFFDTPSALGSSAISQISGEIKYEAASLLAPIEGIKSIDMVVSGHAYSVSELDFWAPSVVDTVTYIFGKDYQDSSLLGTNDFYISLIGGAGLVSYGFTIEGVHDYWRNFAYFNQNSVSFSFAEDSQNVSEPDSLALVGLALVGIAGVRRRGRGLR